MIERKRASKLVTMVAGAALSVVGCGDTYIVEGGNGNGGNNGNGGGNGGSNAAAFCSYLKDCCGDNPENPASECNEGYSRCIDLARSGGLHQDYIDCAMGSGKSCDRDVRKQACGSADDY